MSVGCIERRNITIILKCIDKYLSLNYNIIFTANISLDRDKVFIYI